MNQREKYLAGITAIAVVVGVGWHLGLADAAGAVAGGSSSIERRQREFDKNLSALEDMLAVERRYRALGQSPIDAARSDLRPVAAFEDFVYSIANRHGFQFPRFRSNAEDIDGADEYQFLSTALQTEGPFANTIAMLKDFERNGLLVKDIEMRSTRDRDLIVVRVTVARIARRQSLMDDGALQSASLPGGQ